MMQISINVAREMQLPLRLFLVICQMIFVILKNMVTGYVAGTNEHLL